MSYNLWIKLVVISGNSFQSEKHGKPLTTFSSIDRNY